MLIVHLDKQLKGQKQKERQSIDFANISLQYRKPGPCSNAQKRTDRTEQTKQAEGSHLHGINLLLQQRCAGESQVMVQKVP